MPSTVAELAPASEQPLYVAVLAVIEAIRAGYEPAGKTLLAVEPAADGTPLLKRLERLYQRKAIVLEDLHSCMELIETYKTERRARKRARECSEKEAVAQDKEWRLEQAAVKRQKKTGTPADGPHTPHQKRIWSRRLFGAVGKKISSCPNRTDVALLTLGRSLAYGSA